MRKDRYRNSQDQQKSADQWGPSDPNSVTARLAPEINIDNAALMDWYSYCVMKYPSLFRGMPLEEFKQLNDQRMADLAEVVPKQTTAQARKEIWERCGKLCWNPETSKSEPSRWNDATGDFELIPAGE